MYGYVIVLPLLCASESLEQINSKTSVNEKRVKVSLFSVGKLESRYVPEFLKCQVLLAGCDRKVWFCSVVGRWELSAGDGGSPREARSSSTFCFVV